MPWWGFALCGFGLWLIGLMTGRALGRSEVYQQMFAQQTLAGSVDPLLRGQLRKAPPASERQA